MLGFVGPYKVVWIEIESISNRYPQIFEDQYCFRKEIWYWCICACYWLMIITKSSNSIFSLILGLFVAYYQLKSLLSSLEHTNWPDWICGGKGKQKTDAEHVLNATDSMH